MGGSYAALKLRDGAVSEHDRPAQRHGDGPGRSRPRDPLRDERHRYCPAQRPRARRDRGGRREHDQLDLHREPLELPPGKLARDGRPHRPPAGRPRLRLRAVRRVGEVGVGLLVAVLAAIPGRACQAEVRVARGAGRVGRARRRCPPVPPRARTLRRTVAVPFVSQRIARASPAGAIAVTLRRSIVLPETAPSRSLSAAVGAAHRGPRTTALRRTVPGMPPTTLAPASPPADRRMRSSPVPVLQRTAHLRRCSSPRSRGAGSCRRPSR